MRTLFATFLIISATSANAQAFCDTRANLVTELKTKYAETQSGYGLTKSGQQMIELFTAKSGTWTILLTRPDGISCAMAAGHSWTIVATNPAAQSQ